MISVDMTKIKIVGSKPLILSELRNDHSRIKKRWYNKG